MAILCVFVLDLLLLSSHVMVEIRQIILADRMIIFCFTLLQILMKYHNHDLKILVDIEIE